MKTLKIKTLSEFQLVKQDLENGRNFSNDTSGWFTINRPQDNTRAIFINDEYRFYKNFKSYAIRVTQLMNRGY